MGKGMAASEAEITENDRPGTVLFSEEIRWRQRSFTRRTRQMMANFREFLFRLLLDYVLASTNANARYRLIFIFLPPSSSFGRRRLFITSVPRRRREHFSNNNPVSLSEILKRNGKQIDCIRTRARNKITIRRESASGDRPAGVHVFNKDRCDFNWYRYFRPISNHTRCRIYEAFNLSALSAGTLPLDYSTSDRLPTITLDSFRLISPVGIVDENVRAFFFRANTAICESI